MTRFRLTPAGLARLVERLDDRDLRIAATLRNVRMASGDQLRRLHFDGVPGADRQARRVLARLAELAVLSRLERVIGGKNAGSAGYIYGLGVAGQHLAQGSGPAGGARARRPWTPSGPFVSHVLAGTELLVRLTEAERWQRLDLLEFAGEPSCWRRFLGASGAVECLKPDAYVRVGVGEFEDAYFVENDLGTESPNTLDGKLARYRAYYATGMEQHRTGVFPRVLWITPDERRRAAVVDACRRQPAVTWPLFRVTTSDQVVEIVAGGVEP